MYSFMAGLVLVLGYGILGTLVLWNFYDWAIRYINEVDLERERDQTKWGWLHIQANKQLGLEFSSYPMPALIFYLLTGLGILLGSFWWYVMLPGIIIGGVLIYLRFKKRKEKEDGKSEGSKNI